MWNALFRDHLGATWSGWPSNSEAQPCHAPSLQAQRLSSKVDLELTLPQQSPGTSTQHSCHRGILGSPSVTPGSALWEFPGSPLGIERKNHLCPTVALTSPHFWAEAREVPGGTQTLPDLVIHSSSFTSAAKWGLRGSGLSLHDALFS